MPNFSFSSTALGSPTIQPESAFYSAMTQVIANGFPTWTQVRQDPASSGQQYLNAAGILLQEADRAYRAAVSGLYIDTADINQADVIFKVQFPRTSPISASSIPPCIGDGLTLLQVTDLNDFLYRVIPTRTSYLTTTSIAPGISFSDKLQYDIPYTNYQGSKFPLQFQYDVTSGKLQKYYLVDTIPDVQPAVSSAKNLLNSYTLNDKDGNPVSGQYKGACLYWDMLFILFDQTIYVFDPRAPLVANTDPSWTGNKEQTTLQALAQVVIVESLTGATGLAFDLDKHYFWIQVGSNYLQYRLFFDYVLFDDINQTFFFREDYTTLTINAVQYDADFFSVWNWFDEFGLFLDTPRLTGEVNADYVTRLKSVFKFRANSSIQGFIDGTTRELGLDYWGYYPSGEYPKNLFPTGDIPSGTPIYVSGAFPSGVKDIAKISALFDPVFYSGVVNSTSNIPSAEFVDYTIEAMQTFPIVWGSGNPDLFGFIWDLSPFDGGLNSANIVPDFFALMPSGIDPKWFQSGVQNPDPSLQDLTVRFYLDSNDNWIPQIHQGDFFIHNKLYHLFSLPGYETISSGTMDYTVLGSGLIIPGQPIVLYDVSGVLASGIEFVQVSNFDANPYEYIYSGGHIYLNAPHDELSLFYETSPSGWYTVPGWDFNPTHSQLDPGFIWISDKEQTIAASGSYSLTATPNVLEFNTGGSVLMGRLLDTDGEPVAGATAFFNLIPSGLGSLTTSSSTTGLDGRAYSFYNPPTTTNIILASGTLTGSGIIEVDALISTLNPNEIWTLYTTPDPTVSGLIVSGLITGANPFYDTHVLVAKNNSYRVAINPGDWITASGGFYNNAFEGEYVIGGTSIDNFNGAIPVGDDFFNIKLDSLNYDYGTGPGLGLVDVTNNPSPSGVTQLAYEADAFATPQVFGKIVLYSVTIPTGPVYVNFDTYAPVKPIAVLQDTPASGVTTLNYGQSIPSGLSYLIGYPLSVQVESWASFNGFDTNHISQTINIDFGNSQTGVFQIAGDGFGGKFLDFISYLRIT